MSVVKALCGVCVLMMVGMANGAQDAPTDAGGQSPEEVAHANAPSSELGPQSGSFSGSSKSTKAIDAGKGREAARVVEAGRLSRLLKAKIDIDGPFTPELYRQAVEKIKTVDPLDENGGELLENTRQFITGKLKASLYVPFLKQILADEGASDMPEVLPPSDDAFRGMKIFVLGKSYAEGDGVPKDMGKAVEQYRKAMGDTGDAASAAGVALGKLYEQGDGVAKNPALALRWYVHAWEAGGGDMDSAHEHIWRLARGGLVAAMVVYSRECAILGDLDEARIWQKKVAAAGSDSPK